MLDVGLYRVCSSVYTGFAMGICNYIHIQVYVQCKHASYWMMHGLSGQHHDSLCRRQLLHPGILCLAGCTQQLVGLLVLSTHGLPPLTSLPPYHLHSCSLIWMVFLQPHSKMMSGDLVDACVYVAPAALNGVLAGRLRNDER